MADEKISKDDPVEALQQIFAEQSQAAMALWGQLLPGAHAEMPEPGDAAHWAEVAQRLQTMWIDFQSEQALKAAQNQLGVPAYFADPAQWMTLVEGWFRQMPMLNTEKHQALWDQGMAVWEGVMGFGNGTGGNPALPLSDRRFTDAQWREQPVYALIHQAYLMLSDYASGLVDSLDGIDDDKKRQLRFATSALVDAFSPSNFPFTNPLVLERVLETRGESLVKGMEHLIADLRRGQLTHTDPDAFKIGENIATTPGKVVHETPLYQLIQYTPTTDRVLETPLVIFPPWINRFYILDLNPKKSFVRWAVAQGVTTFMVSWKSADASMAEVTWDDYIAAQIDAIDVIRQRLDVPSVHTIGYCVAGTTLAATLAVLARRDEADKVRSATFFTAQVDFEEAGELKHFVDDQQIETLTKLAPEGFLDGRYMAATFNLLRGQDLIWSYVVNNYLLGQDYPAFDLLHWNGDVTNLPAKWHQNYLKDLYRDNRMIVPDALSAGGTPIDLTKVATPAYVQAGREDHIAPPESVWKITRHFRGPIEFVLAGSGHIAGVVNPPETGKYQYWTSDRAVDTLQAFIEGAREHAGSWWPHWMAWLCEQNPEEVKAKGKRKPGSKPEDSIIEDAPGRYVKTR
jgi:polyhydroxyalkanoate synthase